MAYFLVCDIQNNRKKEKETENRKGLTVNDLQLIFDRKRKTAKRDLLIILSIVEF
jgi:hypothetical protein